jgi:hypothetical protein
MTSCITVRLSGGENAVHVVWFLLCLTKNVSNWGINVRLQNTPCTIRSLHQYTIFVRVLWGTSKTCGHITVQLFLMKHSSNWGIWPHAKHTMHHCIITPIQHFFYDSSVWKNNMRSHNIQIVLDEAFIRMGHLTACKRHHALLWHSVPSTTVVEEDDIMLNSEAVQKAKCNTVM